MWASKEAVRAAEESLVLEAHWRQGDVFHFERVKSRKKTKAGKVTLKSTARSDLEINVVSADEGGFVVSWKLGETKFDDPSQEEDPLVQNLTNVYDGCRVELRLDCDANVVGVRNWKELKEVSERSLEVVIRPLQDKGINEAFVAKLRSELASRVSTKQQIEQYWTREPGLFFLAVGREYEPGKPTEYEDELPNPLGGEPIPSRARFALREYDKKSGLARVTWTQTAECKLSPGMMQKTLGEWRRLLGKPAVDGGAAAFTLEDSAEFTVEVHSGWVQSLVHKRVVRSGEIAQEDTITLRKKESAGDPTEKAKQSSSGKSARTPD